MATYEENDLDQEIKQEYPSWYKAGLKFAGSSLQKIPGYVLPMLLTLLVLVAYVGVNQLKSNIAKNEVKPNNQSEQRLAMIEQEVSKNRNAINLLAVLHNENFASVRQSSGNQNLIFINKDWTIDKIPEYLTMNAEQKNMMKSLYMKENKKESLSSPIAPQMPELIPYGRPTTPYGRPKCEDGKCELN